MLKNLLRKDKHNLELFRDIKNMLDNDWAHALSVKLVRAYFEADIDHPALLKHILSKISPEFAFMDKICNIFHTQN